MSVRPSSKHGVQAPEPPSGAPPVDAPVLKPYLSIAELAQLTPWTDQAIRTIDLAGSFEKGSILSTSAAKGSRFRGERESP